MLPLQLEKETHSGKPLKYWMVKVCIAFISRTNMVILVDSCRWLMSSYDCSEVSVLCHGCVSSSSYPVQVQNRICYLFWIKLFSLQILQIVFPHLIQENGNIGVALWLFSNALSCSFTPIHIWFSSKIPRTTCNSKTLKKQTASSQRFEFPSSLRTSFWFVCRFCWGWLLWFEIRDARELLRGGSTHEEGTLRFTFWGRQMEMEVRHFSSRALELQIPVLSVQWIYSWINTRLTQFLKKSRFSGNRSLESLVNNLFDYPKTQPNNSTLVSTEPRTYTWCSFHFISVG